jgi:hypothetical protein
MYGHWGANAAVVVSTLLVAALCVLVHYEGLVLAQRRIARPHRHMRLRVLHAVSLVIVLHVVEIWIFGLAYWTLLHWPASGSVAGVEPAHFLDHIYLSAMCFTTVGFGDVTPVGAIRFMAATEALVGLVLITWSASFMYLEMESYWREVREAEKGSE